MVQNSIVRAGRKHGNSIKKKARKPRPYPALHLALASINIYNEKYEIYKTESNAKGRRDSKE